MSVIRPGSSPIAIRNVAPVPASSARTWKRGAGAATSTSSPGSSPTYSLDRARGIHTIGAKDFSHDQPDRDYSCHYTLHK